MRIAIAHPTTIDQVRRGNERYVDELAGWLAARGHEVTVLACKAGPTTVTWQNGYRQLSRRRLWHPLLERFGVLESYPFLFTVLYGVMTERFDVIHACTHTSGLAARLARLVTGTPYVYLINALPPAVKYYRALTTNGRVFAQAARHASEVICVSEYVRQFSRQRFARDGVCIPPAVDIDKFCPSDKAPFDPPVILCAAALGDRRKGGRPLMRAFNILKARRPDVQLWNVGPIGAADRDALLDLVDDAWRHDVRFFETAADGADLPELFARATVSVLPSMWEAFGMVTIESLACGTPVVGTRDGATPELLDDPRTGCLFDPGENSDMEPSNVEGLADALLAGLELAAQPGTAAACRARAEHFQWAVVGPMYEDLYTRVIEQARQSRRA